MFTSIKVKILRITVGTNDNVVVNKPTMLKQNYPNPFNQLQQLATALIVLKKLMFQFTT